MPCTAMSRPMPLRRLQTCCDLGVAGLPNRRTHLSRAGAAMLITSLTWTRKRPSSCSRACKQLFGGGNPALIACCKLPIAACFVQRQSHVGTCCNIWLPRQHAGTNGKQPSCMRGPHCCKQLLRRLKHLNHYERQRPDEMCTHGCSKSNDRCGKAQPSKGESRGET